MIKLFYKFCRLGWVPVFWTLLIIFLLIIPGSGLPPVSKWWKFEGYDKVIHFLMFASFVVVWSWHYGYIKANNPHKWRLWVLCFTMISIILGVVMEYVQRDYIPNRSFDVYDIVADTAGAVVAAILVYLIPLPVIRNK